MRCTYNKAFCAHIFISRVQYKEIEGHTELSIILWHEMRHSFSQPNSHWWRALRILRQGYVADLSIKFDNNRIFWSSRSQRSLYDRRDTFCPKLSLPVGDYIQPFIKLWLVSEGRITYNLVELTHHRLWSDQDQLEARNPRREARKWQFFL